MQRVLITGAAGRLGRVLRKGLASPDLVLRLLDIADLGPAGEGEEIWNVDATDLGAMVEAMADVDAVIHLAAYPEEAGWEVVFPLNYSLTYATFEAARRAGVRRVVFCSSIQTVGFHQLDTTIDVSARVRPSGFYGVSKAFGEALGSLYADKYGLTVACVRVASFEPEPTDVRMLSNWLSPEDAIRLFDRCLVAPDRHFWIVYGVSRNSRARVDNSHVAWLGYEPTSNAEDHREEIMRRAESLSRLEGETHGGRACAVGFCGDVEQTLTAE